MTSAESLLQDRDWRIKNSLWILGTLFCCCGTWASFLYVGISAKRQSWLIAAAGYGAATIGLTALIGSAPTAPDGATDSSSWQSNVGTLLVLAVWLGGFVHAVVINRTWLRIKAVSDSSPWHATQSHGAVSAAPARGAMNAPGLAHLPPPPTSVPFPPAPPPYAGPVGGGVEPSSRDDRSPIDVNLASLSDLLGLAGLDADSAERAILARQRQDGFRSVEEFISAAQLPPHISENLRDRLTVSSHLPEIHEPEQPD